MKFIESTGHEVVQVDFPVKGAAAGAGGASAPGKGKGPLDMPKGAGGGKKKGGDGGGKKDKAASQVRRELRFTTHF